MFYCNDLNAKRTLGSLDTMILVLATVQTIGLVAIADATTSGIRFGVAVVVAIGGGVFMTRSVMKAR